MKIQLSGKKLIKFLYTHQSTKQFENTIQRLKHHKQENNFSIDDIYVFLLLYVPRILENQNLDATSIEKQFLSILKKSPQLTEKNFHIPANIPFFKLDKKNIKSPSSPKIVILDEMGYYFSSSLTKIATLSSSLRKKNPLSSIDLILPTYNQNTHSLDSKKHKISNLKTIFNFQPKFGKNFYSFKMTHKLLKRVQLLYKRQKTFQFPKHSYTKLHKLLPFKSSMTNGLFLNRIQSTEDILNYEECIFSSSFNKNLALKQEIFHTYRLIKKSSSQKDSLLLLTLLYSKQSYFKSNFKNLCCDPTLISWIYDHDRYLFPNILETDVLKWTKNTININDNLTDDELINFIFPHQEIFSNYKSIYQHIKNLKFSDLFFNINNFNYLEECNINYYERLKNPHLGLGLNPMESTLDNNTEQYIHLDPLDILLRNHRFNYLVNDELFIMSLLCTYEPKTLAYNLSKERILNTVFNFLENLDSYLSNCSQFIYSDLMIDIIKSGYWNPTKEQLTVIKNKLNIFINDNNSINSIKNNPSLTEKILIIDTLLFQAELEEFTPIKQKATTVNKY